MNLFAIGRSWDCSQAAAIPGHWCGSAFERAVFWLFKQAEDQGFAGEVTLQPRAVPPGPSKHRYHADIRFTDLAGGRGECHVEAKGIEHASWHRNLKDWAHYGPGPLLIFKGKPERVVLWKIVFPQGGNHG